MSEENNTIPSVVKALKIMDFLYENTSGTSLGDISAHLKIPRSTAYRIVKTLESGGLLSHIPERQTYRLGPALVRLASVAATFDSNAELRMQARPLLEDAVRSTGELFKISIREGAKAVVLDFVDSDNPLTPGSRIGAEFPLHAGAAGKVLLSFSSSDVTDDELETFTPQTLTNNVTLEKELHVIRQSGIAFDRGEFIDGVCAVAAPVFDCSNIVIAAISCTFFASGKADAPQHIRQALTQAAIALSAKMGASANTYMFDAHPNIITKEK